METKHALPITSATMKWTVRWFAVSTNCLAHSFPQSKWSPKSSSSLQGLCWPARTVFMMPGHRFDPQQRANGLTSTVKNTSSCSLLGANSWWSATMVCTNEASGEKAVSFFPDVHLLYAFYVSIVQTHVIVTSLHSLNIFTNHQIQLVFFGRKTRDFTLHPASP